MFHSPNPHMAVFLPRGTGADKVLVSTFLLVNLWVFYRLNRYMGTNFAPSLVFKIVTDVPNVHSLHFQLFLSTDGGC